MVFTRRTECVVSGETKVLSAELFSGSELLNHQLTTQDLFEVPGGITGGATPVPIPNTEVKPSKADDTAAVRQWESRTLPGFKKSLLVKASRLFYCRCIVMKKVGWFYPAASITILR